MNRLLQSARFVGRGSLRSLTGNPNRTLVLGGICFFSALIVVMGTSIVSSIDRTMSHALIGSVVGHIQVYSSRSRDALAVVGASDPEGQDLEPLEDFARVREAIARVPHVRSVVPMGLGGAVVTSGNTLDLALADLRAQVGAAPRDGARVEDAKAHLRQMLRVLAASLETLRRVQDEGAISADDAALLARVAGSEPFWADFDRDPLAALELLENRIAPLAGDADTVFIRYLATDPQAFAHGFDRMRIVNGTTIPRGRRGLLVSQPFYEDVLKLKTARRLDMMRDTLAQNHTSIAANPGLQRLVAENVAQLQEILLQLDEAKAARLLARLHRFLGGAAPDVAHALAAFLQMDDANFQERYHFFYAVLAPELRLYRFQVGDTLTIRAFTRGGYVQSINVPIVGTFQFDGLERSPEVAQINLLDLVSFRELHGFATAEQEQEIRALKAARGIRDIPRDRAEAELFGAPLAPAPTPMAGAAAVDAHDRVAAIARRRARFTQPYDPQEVATGAILNAAVILDDPERVEETRAAIEEAGRQAHLPLRAVAWKEAAGAVGQLVQTLHGLLLGLSFAVFLVALVVINNALVIATLGRVREIGTLRAMGASRAVVLAMVIAEVLAVALATGVPGAAAGAGLVRVLGRVGIPATGDLLFFVFSGPALRPTLAGANFLTALGVVLLVGIFSSLYPARLAFRVSPREAMQTEE